MSSKWCEVHFIKSKDEVFNVFKEYKALVENQTGQRIKCIQSDNGREYVNSRFDSYLKDHGIKRRLIVGVQSRTKRGSGEEKSYTPRIS